MKIIAENKKAYFNYEILESFEAGISLLGQEVKSIRTNGINLSGSYVSIRNEEAFWINAGIPPYQPNNIGSAFDMKRNRKLLLKKSEIKYLLGKTKERSASLVPLKLYTKNGRIKLQIGLVKGKKEVNKKEKIKKRTIEKDIERELKNYRG